MWVRRGGGGGGGGEGDKGGEKAGVGAVRAAACLPLQCPPNIMMLSCDVSNRQVSRGGAENGAASGRHCSGATGELSAPGQAAR